MKITIDTKTLAAAAKRADIIYGRTKGRHDIVIAADEHVAHITSNNLSAQVRVPLNGARVGEPGRVLVGPKTIVAIPVGGETTLTAADGNVDIDNGAGWSTTIYETPVDRDYVARYFTVDERNTALHVATIPARRLADTIERVFTSASRDAVRPILCGVLVEETADGLRLVATDSYRLTVETVSGVSATLAEARPGLGGCPAEYDGPLGGPVILPADARKLPRIIGKTGYAVIERAPTGEVTVAGERATVAFQPVDGTFPQWRSLLFGKEKVEHTVTIDKTALLDTLKPFVAAAKARGKTGPGVLLRIGVSVMELSIDDTDAGVMAATVHADIQHTADMKFNIRFDPGFLTDAVAVVQGDTVTLQFQANNLKPALITGPDGLLHDTGTLLMPMRGGAS